MRLCEAVLMAVISMVGIHAAYTDIKYGGIYNRSLIVATTIGGVINALYLLLYARNFLQLYVVNLAIISIFAVALYGFHFWAAGDSKLMICFTVLFPARLYDKDIFSYAPTLNVIVYVFLVAYFYIVIDSILCFIRKDRFYSGKQMGYKELKQFLMSYMICFLYMRALSEILRVCLKDLYYDNQLVFSFMFFFIAMMIHSKAFFRKWYALGLVILANVAFLPTYKLQLVNLYAYGLLLIALLFRYLLSGYNYKQIPTESVKKGMVLSIPTVMGFSSSRVKGLPQISYEDMRSRLSEDEVEAILRWKDSKQGKQSITIVKKIPFAIFIVIGEVMFYFVRVWR